MVALFWRRSRGPVRRATNSFSTVGWALMTDDSIINPLFCRPTLYAGMNLLRSADASKGSEANTPRQRASLTLVKSYHADNSFALKKTPAFPIDPPLICANVCALTTKGPINI